MVLDCGAGWREKIGDLIDSDFEMILSRALGTHFRREGNEVLAGNFGIKAIKVRAPRHRTEGRLAEAAGDR